MKLVLSLLCLLCGCAFPNPKEQSAWVCTDATCLEKRVHVYVEPPAMLQIPNLFVWNTRLQDLRATVVFPTPVALMGQLETNLMAFCPKDDLPDRMLWLIKGLQLFVNPFSKGGAFTEDARHIGQSNNMSVEHKEGNQFQANLIPQSRYLLIVNPEGACGWPPQMELLETSVEPLYDRVVFAPDPMRIFGQIQSEETFFGKATVRLTWFGHLISSVAEIGPDNRFVVTMDRKLMRLHPLSNVVLHVEPKPSYRYLPLIQKPIGLSSLGQDMYLKPIKLASSMKHVQVAVCVRDRDKRPVAQARVVLKGKFDSHNILQEAFTNEKGMSEFQTLAAVYDVLVLPSEKDPIHAFQHKKWHVNSEQQLLIHLQKRRSCEGRVLHPTGDGFQNAHVRFVKNSELHFQVEAVSDAEGRLCRSPYADLCEPVYLDDGMYDIWIRPPDGSMYPLLHHTLQFPQESCNAFVVPEPVLFKGQIRKADGTPIPHSVVRVYDASSFYHPFKEPLLIAEGYTNESGEYTLALEREGSL